MVKKKKISTEIEEYKTFFNDNNKKLNIYIVKTSLKSILIDYNNNFNIINQLVLDSNEYVIQTYQFMRLYFLYCFHNDLDFITIDKDSVLYFMRTLGIRDNRGSKPDNNDLEDKLNVFYQNEFYPLIQKPTFSLITPNLRKMGQLKLIFYKIIIYHLVFNIYKNIKII